MDVLILAKTDFFPFFFLTRCAVLSHGELSQPGSEPSQHSKGAFLVGKRIPHHQQPVRYPAEAGVPVCAQCHTAPCAGTTHGFNSLPALPAREGISLL